MTSYSENVSGLGVELLDELPCRGSSSSAFNPLDEQSLRFDGRA